MSPVLCAECARVRLLCLLFGIGIIHSNFAFRIIMDRQIVYMAMAKIEMARTAFERLEEKGEAVDGDGIETMNHQHMHHFHTLLCLRAYLCAYV